MSERMGYTQDVEWVKTDWLSTTAALGLPRREIGAQVFTPQWVEALLDVWFLYSPERRNELLPMLKECAAQKQLTPEASRMITLHMLGGE